MLERSREYVQKHNRLRAGVFAAPLLLNTVFPSLNKFPNFKTNPNAETIIPVPQEKNLAIGDKISQLKHIITPEPDVSYSFEFKEAKQTNQPEDLCLIYSALVSKMAMTMFPNQPKNTAVGFLLTEDIGEKAIILRGVAFNSKTNVVIGMSNGSPLENKKTAMYAYENQNGTAGVVIYTTPINKDEGVYVSFAGSKSSTSNTPTTLA